jgi:pyrroloquinoline quinone biosynthesis protein B
MWCDRLMTVEAILLGTAQDGGLPQAGCHCARCAPAHIDPALRQRVVCLALVDHATHQSWLIDATPDFREQLHALHSLAPDCPLAGILLTHAHIGHYTGLIHLGREAWNTHDLPVYASPRMASFLRENAPWSQLVALGNISLRAFLPSRKLRRDTNQPQRTPVKPVPRQSGAPDSFQESQLSPNLHVTPVQVPHRDEFSDTLAFIVRAPARRLFYCPDIDTWDRWAHDLRRFAAEVDIALLDGTFFSADELQGRDPSQIPHPLVTDTAERLAGVTCDVRLIHLNHSNPLHRPGPERDWLVARGIAPGTFGTQWRLD